MGPPAAVPAAPRAGFSRLAGIGVVVFLANAGLLVLQLLAGRLLAPFVGSSLETWTGIIGGFLAGIALGNAAGGRLADRNPTGKALAAVLALGGVSALWVVGLPELLAATGLHTSLPLGIRIPVLAIALCFPPGFVLSLPTPLAIRLGLPDVRQAGRVAGLVFALGTLGCLVGNYVTGFYLIPSLTVNTIALTTAGLLFATAVGAALFASGFARITMPSGATAPQTLSPARLTLRRAYLIVFLCSFGAMAVELGAFRIMAQVLGVSLYSVTGVIGVMLAGTACGNWLGGLLADWAAKSADPERPSERLGFCLVVASFMIGLSLLLFHSATLLEPDGESELNMLAEALYKTGPVARTLAWSFLLFFVPMLLLGTISPQVIRLAVPDVAHAGRVAGRVYAWSTAGAIAGTFATGYLLVSTIGVYRSILVAAALPGVASVLAAPVWRRSHLLYTLAIAMGGVVGGFILLRGAHTKITRETNYYTIKVGEGYDLDEERTVRTLVLDLLVHSKVDIEDPTYIHYKHEYVQIEFLRAAALAHPEGQRVLVIGGGGYTFPRYVRTRTPSAAVDVVEIDPGVTEVAYDVLGLKRELGVVTYNMDGRQFVAERAAPGSYHVISLDAVNDLAVPSHLLTREFNEGVKKALTPDGVYLLTVIDILDQGQLWRAAVHTLRETFPHVEVLAAYPQYEPRQRQVYVIYAANHPLNLDALRRTAPSDSQLSAVVGPAAHAVQPYYTRRLPTGEEARLLGLVKPVVLTDQFAPTDALMTEVYRHRER